jgi:hypothetical protein
LVALDASPFLPVTNRQNSQRRVVSVDGPIWCHSKASQAKEASYWTQVTLSSIALTVDSDPTGVCTSPLQNTVIHMKECRIQDAGLVVTNEVHNCPRICVTCCIIILLKIQGGSGLYEIESTLNWCHLILSFVASSFLYLQYN